jgi:DNA-directed RNA polymerase beta subunit
MATKKNSTPKATPKKSSTFSAKEKKVTPAKPVAKTAKHPNKIGKVEVKKTKTPATKPIAKPAPAKKATTPTVPKKIEKTAPIVKIDAEEVIDKPALSTKELLAPTKIFTPTVKTKVQNGFFKGYDQVDDRIFLSNPKTYGEIPDLLELQKRGYEDFLTLYLPKLFEEMNPIRDIGGNHLNVSISNIKVSEPIESIETCKKKELTYGGIITAKIKLVEIVEDEKTKKKSEKMLFSKSANVGILPIMTPSATYIINGVERVIISQIVRSYGIFYSKKELRYSCKLIPENGPWLEIDVEKFGTIVARINKSRKFPITALFRVFGIEDDDEIKEFFKDCFEDESDVNYLDITLKKDKDTTDAISAAEFIYNKLRPGEIIDPQSALDYVKAQFMDPNRIYVGRIARRKINAKL